MRAKQSIMNRLANEDSAQDNSARQQKKTVTFKQERSTPKPVNPTASSQSITTPIPTASKVIEDTKVMNKRNGCVKGYSANTFSGLVRNYNEDRVSIILNITKPDSPQKWPKCSYFAVFDGHGGSLCSDFLRDNMHRYIIEDKNFPFKPVEALKNGFHKAENQFRKIAESTDPINKSGSCAIVALIIDRDCYIANLGDSRAIMSAKRGKKTIALSEDHKPNYPGERNRIIQNGGNIYQSVVTAKNGVVVPGPFRIHPGRLSVSRAIGDFTAKDQKYEGNPGVLIAEPQITHIRIQPTEHDFILLACDGIFDKLSNEEIIRTVWKAEEDCNDKEQFMSMAVTAVLQESMNKKSLDNVTAVLVMLDKETPPAPQASVPKKPVIGNFFQPKSSAEKPKTNRDIYRLLDDLNKESSRRRAQYSQAKENTNYSNVAPSFTQKDSSNNITTNLYALEQKSSQKSMQRLNKKSSLQINPKKLDLYSTKPAESQVKTKMHEYIRY